MIIGIGTDLVKVDRVARGWRRFGDRFAHRILAPQEISEFNNNNKKAMFLAKRFAAKEAVAKALGTGIAQGISFKHIYIDHDDLGKPVLVLEQQALNHAEGLGIKNYHVSISDETDFVVAFVVLES